MLNDDNDEWIHYTCIVVGWERTSQPSQVNDVTIAPNTLQIYSKGSLDMGRLVSFGPLLKSVLGERYLKNIFVKVHVS